MVSGHCLCKKVTFTAGEPVLVGFDHCDDCQRQSGSSYSLVVVVKTDSLKIEGPVSKYSSAGDSGKQVVRTFCSNCGSPIAHAPDAAPEITALKGGCLDNDQKRNLKPTEDIYAKDKLPFLTTALEHVHQTMP